MLTKNITLESVAIQLNAWRANRKNRYSAKIPIELKNAIKSLSPKYSYSEISRTLGYYAVTIAKQNINSTSKLKFVELPNNFSTNDNSKFDTTTNHQEIHVSRISCNIKNNDGATMTIETNIQHLNYIMKEFLCCN